MLKVHHDAVVSVKTKMVTDIYAYLYYLVPTCTYVDPDEIWNKFRDSAFFPLYLSL